MPVPEYHSAAVAVAERVETAKTVLADQAVTRASVNTSPFPMKRSVALDVDMPDGGYRLDRFEYTSSRASDISFHAVLTRGGRTIGDVVDRGSGPHVIFDNGLEKEEERFNEWVAAFPDGDNYPEMALAMLTQDHEATQELNRVSRTQTAFLTPGESAVDGYRSLKAPYTNGTKGRINAALTEKFGEGVRVYVPDTGWVTVTST